MKSISHVVFAYIMLIVLFICSCATPATPTPVPSSPAPTTPSSPPIQPPAPPPKPTSVPKEVELKYDDGSPDQALAAGGGFLVDFMPTSVPFTIKKIKIIGALNGSGYDGKTFKVEIWDKEQKILHSATYPVTLFPTESMSKTPVWTEVEIPNITVNDKFFVHVYTGTNRLQGIHIGADNSIANEHSEQTLLTVADTVKIRTDWPFPKNEWYGDKSKVNWMIRTIGTYIPTSSAQTTVAITEPSISLSALENTAKSTPMTTKQVTIKTLHENKDELSVRDNLQILLSRYDLSKWIFTSSVLIQEGARSHSHPILTLGTGFKGLLLLSVFLHEQIHWFLVAKAGQVMQAKNELRILYPKVPVGGTEGADNEDSTYLHLIVNFLELSAMKQIVGDNSAVSTIEQQSFYRWIYKTVLLETNKIGEIVQKYGLTIE